MSAAQPPKRRKSARTPEAHFQPEADGFLPSVAGLLGQGAPSPDEASGDSASWGYPTPNELRRRAAV